jgi:tetratricopeptide (TPR) repeat protein
MKLNPRHPGAHHLYIHSVEASNRPEKGVVSADTLMELVPGAGHLVHMPAHIYLRVGRWEEAAQANINATKADAEFRKANSQPGFYAVYMLHNHHFLSFVRMMQGQHGAALEAARSMVAGVPEDFMREFGPIADGYMAIVYEVQMRFGKWEELLAEPAPPAHLPLANALWRFSRATALNALDRRKEAQDERRQFLSAVTEVPSDATFGNNDAHTLLQLARHVLDGEIAAREKRYSAALRELYAAKRIEDTLMYDEPPDWILPVRHTLGATLLSAGKAAEAEAVYREDLKNFPKNGWSLYGLSRALALQGKEAEASEVRREFAREWADADTQIASSCLCQNEA